MKDLCCINPEYLPLDLDTKKYQAVQEADALKEYAAQEAAARKAEEENKKFKEGYQDAMNSFRFAGGMPGQDYMQLAALAGITNSQGPREAAKAAGYSALGQLAGGALGAASPYIGRGLVKGAGWLLRAGWNPASTGYSAIARWFPKVSSPLAHGVTKAIDVTAVHLPAYLESAKDVGNKILGKENWFTDKEGNFSAEQTLGSVLDPLMIKSGIGEWKPVLKQLPGALKAFQRGWNKGRGIGKNYLESFSDVVDVPYNPVQ